MRLPAAAAGGCRRREAIRAAAGCRRSRRPCVELPGMEANAAVARETISFDENGLVPCVTQDWRTGEVLTLAYMNRAALDRTIETGEVHFWSRSRDELWHKGATSGNVQRLRTLRYDCDADAVLALVEPDGPACHTGARSCFHRTLDAPAQIAPHE